MHGRSHALRPTSPRSILLCVALLLAIGAKPVHADAADDRRALVMLRVLAYDKHLGVRAGDEVRILIVYPDTSEGAVERARWVAAFANARKLKVDGRPVVVTAHKFDTTKALDRALQDHAAAAVIACDGLSAKLGMGQLAGMTRAHDVLSITTRETDVAKGLALGVVRGKTRDEIVVNVRAAVAEGVKFDAGLLQLARTVEEPR